MSKKLSLPRTLTTTEFRAGLIYFVVHVFALPWLLSLIWGMLDISGIYISTITINAIYQFIGIGAILMILRKYLVENFERFISWLPINLVVIVAGFFIYYAVYIIFANIIYAIAGGELSNPNSEFVTAMTKSDLYSSIALTVLLAPIVEECLYRGVLFNGIGAKSRFWGYLVSMVLFAFSHVFHSMVTSFDPSLFLTMLIYMPAGYVLARAYEKSGTIWCPIFIHIALNLTAQLISYYYT